MLDFQIYTNRKIDQKKWQKIASLFKIKATVVIIDPLEHPIRGCSFKGEIIIVFDHPKETENSLFWIFLHELRHRIVSRKKYLQEALYNRKRDILVDAIDQIPIEKGENPALRIPLLPEEIEADTFASEIAKGYYGMEWWEEKKSEKK